MTFDRNHGSRGLADRLQAELVASGMTVDVRLKQTDEPRHANEIEGELRAGVSAVVHIQLAPRRIEVVIADPVTGETKLRDVLEWQKTPAENADAVLALRTAETLRAVLAHPPDRSSSGALSISKLPTIVAPLTALPPAAGSPRMAVALSAGLALASGGLGPQAQLGLHLRLGLSDRLGVELIGLVPVTSAPVPGIAAVDARASVWLGGGVLSVHRPIGRKLSVDLGVGGLAIVLHIAGNPSAGWTGTAQTGLGVAGCVSIGANVPISRMIAVRGELIAGDAFRRPVAAAGGPGERAWGPGFGTALTAIEARWF